LSLLPLAHIFERMVMHFYLSTGMSIYFADDVRNVGDLLRSVHPTIMTVVPRLLEKVCFKMRQKAMAASLLKRLMALIAFHRAQSKDPLCRKIWLDNLLDTLVYAKFRDALGGKIRMLISGGAPLADDLYRFFLNIGIPLYQGYGLTEASPVICANAPGENRVGTCGRSFTHTEVKINTTGELLARGRAAYVLDGDNIRHGLNADLDFSPQSRKENIRRIGCLAALFADAGLITVTAFISPYREDRTQARATVAETVNMTESPPFIEVFVNTPLEICEARDPKQLYQKARAGEISDFTGISAPYEPPLTPEIELQTAHRTVSQSVEQIISYLNSAGIIPAQPVILKRQLS